MTLKKILQNDELHLVKTLLNVELSVKCESFTSKYFKTDTGAPQGDCASANEFTFYLAKSLENKIQNYEHDYAKIKSIEPTPSQYLEEHSYYKPQHKKHITINQEYTDDISVITSNPDKIKQLKKTLPTTFCKKSHNKYFKNRRI